MIRTNIVCIIQLFLPNILLIKNNDFDIVLT